MSAFMLGDSAFDRIATYLAFPDRKYGQAPCYLIRPGMREQRWSELTLSEAIVRDWYVANRLAVQGRYEGRHGTDEIRPMLPDTWRVKVTTAPESSVAMYKLMQCLAYQCAETVAPGVREQHAEWCAEIESAVAHLGAVIVSSLPEYEVADWG